MAELLVDTDVCIDHLHGRKRLPPRHAKLAYSVVTRAELLAGPSGQHAAARRMLAALSELPVDRRIAERAAAVRRDCGLRLPDALIAGTALVHDLTLLTRNRSDFRRVPDLRLR